MPELTPRSAAPKKSSRPHVLHPSWAFYVFIVGIILGVIIAFVVQPLCSGIVFLIAAFALLLISIFRTNYFTVTLAFIAGIILASCRVMPEVVDAKYLSAQVGQTLTISGKISAEPNISDSGTTFNLTNLTVAPETNLRGTIYVQLSGKHTELMRSDRLTLTGKLSSGFGTFSGAMFRPELVTLERAEPGDLPAKFKNFFADLIHDQIPSPAAELGLAYLVGDKTGLSEDFSDALRAVGMTHVVVASGAHLGTIVGLIKKLFGKVSKFAGLLFSLLAIFAFALVVGFTASMTRASLVAALSLLAAYVGRTFTPLRLILFVAALTLLITPSNFFNLGWQLSFASFFGILILAPRLTKHFYGGKKPPWLAGMLITSFATSIICAPLLIFNFGTFSLLSFVANLIILPTLPYAMLLVFLSGATSFLPPITAIISAAATFLLDSHIAIINFLSTKTALIFEPPAADFRIFLLYLPVLYCLLRSPIRRCLQKLTPRRLELVAETVNLCYNDKHEPPTRQSSGCEPP